MSSEPPPNEHPSKDPESFAFEKYKLDREHELELNRATAAYEHANLRILMVLNGGTAAAFLTLLGAIFKSSNTPNLYLAFFAILAWVFGLALAAGATERSYQRQQGFTKAYRFRRQAEELRRMGPETPESRDRLGIGLGKTSKCLDQLATKERCKATNLYKCVRVFSLSSIASFIIGAVVAALSMTPFAASEAGFTSFFPM